MKQRKKQQRAKTCRVALALLAIGAAAIGAALIATKLMEEPASEQGFTVEVTPAQLSDAGMAGEALFKANCAACHGLSAAGTKLGPPLVHDIYNPGHHSDQAFYLAAAVGVRAHHWNYGDMPAQPQVSRDEVERIVRYVRELQEANGIEYGRPGM